MSFVQDCDGAQDNTEAWHKGLKVQNTYQKTKGKQMCKDHK